MAIESGYNQDNSTRQHHSNFCHNMHHTLTLGEMVLYKIIDISLFCSFVFYFQTTEINLLKKYNHTLQ